MRRHGLDFRGVGDIVDHLQLAFDGVQTLLFQSGIIHSHAIDLADLLIEASLRDRGVVGCAIHYFFDAVVGSIIYYLELSVSRFVCRHRVAFYPSSLNVIIEVVSRTY